MFGPELEFKPAFQRASRSDRVLRNDAAIPFQFHLELIARQDGSAEIENVGKPPGLESMVEILRDVSLQDARFAFAEGAAAIDELFRDMTDFSDVKMRRYLLAARQDKSGKRFRLRAEESFQFAKLHDGIYILVQEYRQAQRCSPHRKLQSDAIYSFRFRNRSAFAITETELKLMAAPAMMGLSNSPKNG